MKFCTDPSVRQSPFLEAKNNFHGKRANEILSCHTTVALNQEVKLILWSGDREIKRAGLLHILSTSLPIPLTISLAHISFVTLSNDLTTHQQRLTELVFSKMRYKK